MRFKVKRSTILYVAAALALVLTLGVSSFRSSDAAPKSGEITFASAEQNADGSFQNLKLLAQGSRTMANTTPVNGETICLDKAYSKFAAELTLSGTMAGTAPTLIVVLLGSYDKVHWFTVHSFAAINATVTPAGGSERAQFSDVAASTAITRPMCYRTQSTWGGSGTVTANYGAVIFGK